MYCLKAPPKHLDSEIFFFFFTDTMKKSNL